MENLRYGPPAAEMEPALRRLWREGFREDGPEYVEFYFRRQFAPDRCRVLTSGGQVLSALHLLPFTLPGGERGHYIYAASTAPEARGRGLYRRLLGETMAEAESRGECLFLASEPPLRSFYWKIGFTGGLYRDRVSIPVSGIAPSESLRLASLTAAEYAPLRERCFPGPGTVLWGEKDLAFALDEARFCDGFALMAEVGELRGTIIGTVQGESLYLQESTFPLPELERLAPALCRALGGSSLQVLVPGEEPPGPFTELSALTWHFPEGPGWAGLTFYY